MRVDPGTVLEEGWIFPLFLVGHEVVQRLVTSFQSALKDGAGS